MTRTIMTEDKEVKLPAQPVKKGQARQGLPGNEDMIIGSAFPSRLPRLGGAGMAGHPADLPVTL